MNITKRRVTKRNRIKRKYSKKRTKTRHSRKRVFSKKRRKTIKKKKRGGMKLPKLFMTKEEKAKKALEEAENKLQKSINDLVKLEEKKTEFLALHDKIITNTIKANEDEKFNNISTYDKKVIGELKKVVYSLGINYNEIISDLAKNIYVNKNINKVKSDKLKGFIERMFNQKIDNQNDKIRMNKLTKTRMETELKEIQERNTK